MDPQARPTSAGVRAALSGLVLVVVWAVAFRYSGLAFFPLIAVGGIVTGLAGLWVRRGALVGPAASATGPDLAHETRAATTLALPGWRLTWRQASLAALVAATHLAAAHVLFQLGTRVLPQLAPTAEQVYGRTGEVSLWWALLVAGVLTAPLEEVYWRGAIQPLLSGLAQARAPRLATGPGTRIVGGALVYAVFHVSTGQVALVAAALLGGLVWGWLLQRTGSVGAPMLAHALWACGMLVLPPV